MKALLLLLLVVVVAVMAYQKKDQLTGTHVQEAVASIDQKANGETAQASPKAEAPKMETPKLEAPKVEAKVTLQELQDLPSNVYYTRVRITEMRETGIAAIAAATKVHRVRLDGTAMVVTNGSTEVKANSEQLTRDAAEILELLNASAQN